MARDEESTQQIDLEALRKARAESGAPASGSAPSDAGPDDDLARSDLGDDDELGGNTAVDALPYQPPQPVLTAAEPSPEIPDPYEPSTSSITRAQFAPMTVEAAPLLPITSESGAYVPMPSVTRAEFAAPTRDAVPVADVDAYEPSTSSITRAERAPSRPASTPGKVPRGATDGVMRGAMSDPVFDDDAPLPSFDLPTDDGDPTPPAPEAAPDADPREETLMVEAAELRRLAASSSIPPPPTELDVSLVDAPDPRGPLESMSVDVSMSGVADVAAATPEDVAVPARAASHPGGDADDTRLDRLDDDDVRAAFAAAEEGEAQTGGRTASGLASRPSLGHIEVDFSEDLGVAEPEAVDEDGDAEELDDDDVLEDEDGELVLRASDPGIEIVSGAVPAAHGERARPAVRAPLSSYVPPVAKRADVAPVYLTSADDDERQLASESAWDALLELHRLRLAEADVGSTKAAILVKIASIHEQALGRPEDALEPLLEAFDLRPMDEAVIVSLERVAKANGQMQQVAERARGLLKNLNDHEARVAILGHLVYWYERLLSRGKDASPFAAELDRLDKSHPVALRRAAQVAASSGDVRAQRELLLRALERAIRDDEKVTLHLQLANSFAGTPESQKHYEAVLAHDPTNIVALQAIERFGRDQEKHPQVEWALLQQSEHAPTESERVRAVLELALLHEKRFLRRESAAELFERVLEMEPAQPQALEGLERCYHALRNWARLAGVLRIRAGQTYDKGTRTHLLERAAEAYEAKLGDFASAVEVHLQLLSADPKHKRALTDLARLYEKLGDWANTATYKSRLAELEPSPKKAAVLFTQLAEMLSAPDRDPIAARLQYEKAVAADPTSVGAWEALQRLAEAAGDERRAAQCLEERAHHAPGPRQRAAALVELAAKQRILGNERAAREAFEAAIDADPSNEAAAREVLETWTREERWAEAAPVCELLVNAAVRDRDADAHFTRLRLATRIHAALADADRAMTTALQALELRPEEPSAQADLVAVTSQCRDQKALVARAKPWLVRIAEGDTVLPADVLVRVAEIHRDEGDLDAAASMYERARKLSSDDPAIQRALADVYLALGDYPRACKLKVDLARNGTSEEARFTQLVEAGEIWARQARELPQAASVFEEARQLKPFDHWLLHTLMWLYGELEEWDKLSSVLEGITRIQESPDRRAKSLYAMAQVVRDKVKDSLRAAELLDELLDLDKKRLDVFEELVRTRTEVKDWDGLERSYRKMIARVKDDGDVALTFALFQQLGLIYRDRIGDAERAYEALDAAARLRPGDVEVRKIVTELLVVTDNVDNAVLRTRSAIERDPHDAELYAELYELYLRQRQFDKAWCAVDVLATLRELTEEERIFLLDYPPTELSQVPGQIVEQAWQTHVFHPQLDRTLSGLFALMTPAVARMRHAQLRPDQMMAAVGRPFTPAHSMFFEPIRAAFANSAEILGMRPPDLLLGDAAALSPFTPALAPFGALLVSPPAVESRADAIVFIAAKRLAEQRPELAARAFFPSVSDLTSLLHAAVRVSRQEGAKDPASAQLDAGLVSVMTHDEREGIRSIVLRAQMEGGRVDVRRWSQMADLSSTRAALLLCGDVTQARRVILAEAQSPADLAPRDRVGELYKFAIGDLYSDLRQAIGVAVPDAEDESSS